MAATLTDGIWLFMEQTSLTGSYLYILIQLMTRVLMVWNWFHLHPVAGGQVTYAFAVYLLAASYTKDCGKWWFQDSATPFRKLVQDAELLQHTKLNIYPILYAQVNITLKQSGQWHKGQFNLSQYRGF